MARRRLDRQPNAEQSRPFCLEQWSDRVTHSCAEVRLAACGTPKPVDGFCATGKISQLRSLVFLAFIAPGHAD